MLCSEAELAIGPDASGVMPLSPSISPGTPLCQALGLSDTVFEIGLTPNRPDCLSFIGVAREVAALLDKKMTRPVNDMPDGTGQIADHTSVAIENPEFCPRYAARMVTGITVFESPDWLKNRLLSIGLKPISNIVDITNFVMMETGQPLHAFDFDRLAENRIVVRTPSSDEKTFTTLDGKPRDLEADTLMICDGVKPVAVAGVMGGENSEISTATTRVLIESAYFNPISIRKTAKRLGLSTDASHRFERGADPEGTVAAANRAAALMVEICGGQLVGGVIDEHPLPSNAATISLSISRTNRHLGTKLDRQQIAGFLKSIEFAVIETGDDTLEVMAPSFRVDVTRPEDLMEEVARLWGYNNICTTFPRISARTELPKPELAMKSHLKDLMAGFGFHEAINYSFIGSNATKRMELADGDRRHDALHILNPLAETQGVMRTSLLPALLEAVQKNIFRQERNLRLFELGKTFYSNGADRLPDEVDMIAGIWTGARQPVSWLEKQVPCDFYDLKGTLEALFAAIGLTTTSFTRAPASDCRYMRPGHTARIRCADADLGLVGEIKPSVLKNFDVRQPVFSFEINIISLKGCLRQDVSYQPIPRFPSVSRDLTMIIDNRVEAGDIIHQARTLQVELVEDITVFDLYRGAPIPDGKKSISIRIIYRSHEETLEDERINALHQKITAHLLKTFDAVLPA